MCPIGAGSVTYALADGLDLSDDQVKVVGRQKAAFVQVR